MLSSVKELFRRVPIFFPIRFWLVLTKPSRQILEEENYNSYNQKEDIPKAFYTENEKMQVKGKTTFDRALHIATYLKGNYPGGTKNLGYSSVDTLHSLQTKPEGTCGDYSQVFILLCILNDIKVREWGVHDRVYKNTVGHVFNEVYLPEQNQWAYIDVHFAIYFRNKAKDRLLSAADIIRMTADGNEDDIEIVHILPVRDYNEGREYIRAIYFGQIHLFFLVTHYFNKKIDDMLDRYRKLPIPLVHLLLILKGDYYKYMLVFSQKTEKEINQKLKVIAKRYQPLL